MSAPFRALLLASCWLAGCTLIDQRTFNPNAGKAPPRGTVAAPVAAVPEAGPKPLLTVRAPVSAGALQADVARAVAAARAVKPGVVFEVVEITPDAGGEVGADAAEVGRLIIAERVPASRVHLAARARPGGEREVRVYVH